MKPSFSIFGLLAMVTWCSAAVVARSAPPAPPPAPPVPPETARQAWLGVFLGDALDGGVQLVAVALGGPAQKADLRPGDVVVRVNGRPVPDRDALRVVLASLHPGDRVSMEILRDGRAETRSLEAAEKRRPAWAKLAGSRDLLVSEMAQEAPEIPVLEGLGARLVRIPSELRVHYGAPPGVGALVLRVERGGTAEAAGIRVGDVLVEVNGEALRDPGGVAFPHPVEAKTLEVVRGGEVRVLRVGGSAEGSSPRKRTRTTSDEERERIEKTIAELRRRLADLERRLEELKEVE